MYASYNDINNNNNNNNNINYRHINLDRNNYTSPPPDGTFYYNISDSSEEPVPNFNGVNYEADIINFPNIPQRPYDVKRLPSRKWTIEDVNLMKNKEHLCQCTICLMTFQIGDNIKMLPCFHQFHVDEIDRWLQEDDKCPICRNSVYNLGEQ